MRTIALFPLENALKTQLLKEIHYPHLLQVVAKNNMLSKLINNLIIENHKLMSTIILITNKILKVIKHLTLVIETDKKTFK